MKAIILENGFECDIPENLLRYMEWTNTEWEWYDMRERFWPVNREETFKFFANLPEGQLLATHHVFVDFQFLELMIQVLHKLRDKKFNVKIMSGSLDKNLLKFYNNSDSSITPTELEKELEKDLTDAQAKKIFKKIADFKVDMNKKFLEVLEAHNIFWIGFHDDMLIKNLDDLKNPKRTYTNLKD